MNEVEHKRAVRLGNLYELVQDVWDLGGPQARNRLVQLVEWYGLDDVSFILEVVTEDRRNALEVDNG